MTAPAPLASPRSVLIVDDDAFSRQVFCTMLAEQGLTEVTTAVNGRDALRALKGMPCPPDFLICDVFMPDMDGIEFLGQLGERHYQGGVILVSGMNAEILTLAQDIALGNGINVLGAFAKPLPHDALASVMSLG